MRAHRLVVLAILGLGLAGCGLDLPSAGWPFDPGLASPTPAPKISRDQAVDLASKAIQIPHPDYHPDTVILTNPAEVQSGKTPKTQPIRGLVAWLVNKGPTYQFWFVRFTNYDQASGSAYSAINYAVAAEDGTVDSLGIESYSGK